MYHAEFLATNSADWAEAIEFYGVGNDCDQSDLIPFDALFELVVRDRRCSPYLRASSAEGTIVRLSANVITWRFPADRMRGLRPGTSYDVGLTMTTPTGTEQILTGTLSFLDGVVK